MKIAIPKELCACEKRVATAPDTVKKLIALGAEVIIETKAGEKASFTDDAYKEAGAKIAKTTKDLYSKADIVFCVRSPEEDQLKNIKKGTVLIGMLAPYDAPEMIKKYASIGIEAFSMELVPRITRAQSMDVLSSQSNLAGYKAVLDAADQYGSAFPLMMTAAGTVPPAKVFVMGAGVAGLQAIATAKRLGAVVSATDVRPVAKEQVESLGGSFVMVESEETKEAETSGGYAKEMSKDYQKKQAKLVAETIAKQDVVITTALIPGRPAPLLITKEMVKTMKPGSVIVDLAAERGGNCELTELDKVVEAHGVKIVGYKNFPARIAADASSLYARNLLNFLTPLVNKESGKLAIDWDDEIIKGCGLTHNGKIVHEGFGVKKKAPAKKTTVKKKAAPKKTATKKKKEASA